MQQQQQQTQQPPWTFPPPGVRLVVFDLETDGAPRSAARAHAAPATAPTSTPAPEAATQQQQRQQQQRQKPRAVSPRGEAFDDVHITALAAATVRDGRPDDVWSAALPPGQTPTDRAATLGRLAAELDAADVVVAFNGRDFDLRVLRHDGGFAPERVRAWARKLLDPFEIIRERAGSWVKLDELLALNCPGVAKSASGAQAVAWWAAGEHDRVRAYCEDDVRALLRLVRTTPAMRFPVKRWQAVQQPANARDGGGEHTGDTSDVGDKRPRTRQQVTLGTKVLRFDLAVRKTCGGGPPLAE